MLRKGDLSLKDRVFRSPGHVSQPSHHLCRPDKYKKWTDQRFLKAIDAVQNDPGGSAREILRDECGYHDVTRISL